MYIYIHIICVQYTNYTSNIYVSNLKPYISMTSPPSKNRHFARHSEEACSNSCGAIGRRRAGPGLGGREKWWCFEPLAQVVDQQKKRSKMPCFLVGFTSFTPCCWYMWDCSFCLFIMRWLFFFWGGEGGWWWCCHYRAGIRKGTGIILTLLFRNESMLAELMARDINYIQWWAQFWDPIFFNILAWKKGCNGRKLKQPSAF